MFRSHIQETCINTSKKIGVLSRLEDMISTETKLHLYKYAILSYLTYCHIVWHFCAKSDRKKLKRIQERALRIVFRGKSATCEELLKKAGLTFFASVQFSRTINENLRTRKKREDYFFMYGV